MTKRSFEEQRLLRGIDFSKDRVLLAATPDRSGIVELEVGQRTPPLPRIVDGSSTTYWIENVRELMRQHIELTFIRPTIQNTGPRLTSTSKIWKDNSIEMLYHLCEYIDMVTGTLTHYPDSNPRPGIKCEFLCFRCGDFNIDADITGSAFCPSCKVIIEDVIGEEITPLFLNPVFSLTTYFPDIDFNDTSCDKSINQLFECIPEGAALTANLIDDFILGDATFKRNSNQSTND